MNWTFTPQVTGLEKYKFPYDPADPRELTKHEDILVEALDWAILEFGAKEELRKNIIKALDLMLLSILDDIKC